VLRKSFYRALVEAKGYQLLGTSTAGGGGGGGGGGSPSPGGGSNAGKGRQAEYRTRVHGNGNLLIGHAYTRRMGLEPGDEFHIELHPETGAIWLLPLEPGEASAITEQLLEDSVDGSEIDDDSEEDNEGEDAIEDGDADLDAG
jgi:bifunctional DNA-binding transcriptional regulator/antitoxin component of YhaV-PrlF toxin-antitoxin module